MLSAAARLWERSSLVAERSLNGICSMQHRVTRRQHCRREGGVQSPDRKTVVGCVFSRAALVDSLYDHHHHRGPPPTHAHTVSCLFFRLSCSPFFLVDLRWSPLHRHDKRRCPFQRPCPLLTSPRLMARSAAIRYGAMRQFQMEQGLRRGKERLSVCSTAHLTSRHSLA